MLLVEQQKAKILALTIRKGVSGRTTAKLQGMGRVMAA